MTGAMFPAGFTPDGSRLIIAGLDETRLHLGHQELPTPPQVERARRNHCRARDFARQPHPGHRRFRCLDHAQYRQGGDLRSRDREHRAHLLLPTPCDLAGLLPDGKWLALTSGDNEVSLWKL